MAEDDQSTLGMLRKLTETFGRAKFGNGVVGKSGYAMVALLIVWAVVVWRISGTWADLALLFAGAVATGAFMWWTGSVQKFAERNPAQAMLEGAEFLAFKRFEAEAKGGLLGSRELTNDPTRPLPPATPTDIGPDE